MFGLTLVTWREPENELLTMALGRGKEKTIAGLIGS